MASPDKDAWIRAMKDEHNSLLENKTWEFVDPPPGRKLLRTKWVFKTKRKANGEIERHKARLVVKGCSQTAGVDYNETYAPVMRHNSLRLLSGCRYRVSPRKSRRGYIRATAEGIYQR